MTDGPSPGDGRTTLQISVAPSDLPHARDVLPHQLRQWARQVDEVLFVLDLGRGSSDRARQRQAHPEITELLEGLCNRHRIARTVLVDYGSSTSRQIRSWLGSAKPPPEKDCYGKVVYPYYFGLWAAQTQYVFHTDSDMIFGGGSSTWIEEAKRVLAHPIVFTCTPLPGPPSLRPLAREVMIRHAGSRRRAALARNAVAFSLPGLHGPGLRFSRMSTRCFMLDRSVFGNGRLTVPVSRPSFRALLGAASKRSLGKGSLRCAPAETALTQAMRRHGLLRVDFLGRAPGMWSLHPPVHSEALTRALADIITRVEHGDVPEQQRGDYDLLDPLHKWSQAWT